MKFKELIQEKIKEVEKLLESNINMLNYDFYDKLLDMHTKLFAILYFEINQRDGFLLK